MAFAQMWCVAVVLTCWVAGLCCGYEDMDNMPSFTSPQQFKDAMFSADEMHRFRAAAGGPKMHDKIDWILALEEEAEIAAEIEAEKMEDENKRKNLEASLYIARSQAVPPALPPHLAFTEEQHQDVSDDKKDAE